MTAYACQEGGAAEVVDRCSWLGVNKAHTRRFVIRERYRDLRQMSCWFFIIEGSLNENVHYDSKVTVRIVWNIVDGDSHLYKKTNFRQKRVTSIARTPPHTFAKATTKSNLEFGMIPNKGRVEGRRKRWQAWLAAVILGAVVITIIIVATTSRRKVSEAPRSNVPQTPRANVTGTPRSNVSAVPRVIALEPVNEMQGKRRRAARSNASEAPREQCFGSTKGN